VIPKLIILEGPDGAGKTTLAQQLVHEFNAKLIRHDAQPERAEMFPYFINSLREAAKHDGRVIFDRCWLSEPIYGAVLRNGGDRVGINRRALDRVALGIGAVVIRCLPALDTVLENFNKNRHEQLPQKDEQMKAIYERYEHSRWVQYVGRQYAYTYTRPGALGDLRDWLGACEFSNHGPGIGNWSRGCTLLIGDTPGSLDPYRTRNLNWPFASNQGCSPWLSTQLEKFGHHEGRLYWINARRVYDRGRMGPERADFIASLSPERVIALGDVARRWCIDHSVGHHHVSHPQYWKRFQAKREWFELKHAFASRSDIKVTLTEV
jgi:hypothetical protein